MQSDKFNVCVHESGHAIVGTAIGKTLIEIVIRYVGLPPRWCGRVTFVGFPLHLDSEALGGLAESDILADLTIAHGGVLAEREICANIQGSDEGRIGNLWQ